MADITKRVNRISLKHLRATEQIQDEFIERLGETYTRLTLKLGAELRKLTSTEGLIDVALARQQVDRIFLESGYFEEIGNLVNEGYQRVINESFLQYQELFGENFQFSEVSLSRIQSLKELDISQFEKLTDDAEELITREVINTQFGAISVKDAIEEMTQIIDGKLVRYANTWVNTAIQGVYSESNVMLALDNGFEQFLYVGVMDQLTRPFCRMYLGETKTMPQWNKLNKDPVRAGQPNPVSIYRGGYNCRHQFVAVK